MYQPTMQVLWTSVESDGFKSLRSVLHSNGTYVRRGDGYLLGRESYKDWGIFFLSEYREKKFTGHITDKVLVERIKCYWDEYLGKYHTNCAAFAHFLTTGVFIEYDHEHKNLVIEQGMRPYEMTGRIDVGDMVCLMYADDRSWSSRKNPYSNSYRKARKHRHDKDGFTGASEMKLQQRSFSPEEIRKMYTDLGIRDYHFMVCVGKRKGKPVWISQGGYALPGEEPVAFSMTCGETDPYLRHVPIIALIKKRR